VIGKRQDHERVDDMLAAIGRIDDHAAIDREAVGLKNVVEDAVKYNFVVIGEAVGDLSTSITERLPDIPGRASRACGTSWRIATTASTWTSSG
jgi:uncharacterized protein with HEPN domain